MFKIEKLSEGTRTIFLRLIGRIRLEHLEELKAQLGDDGPRIKLDLDEVTLVDLDVVRFLRACEIDGIQLVNCSPYVREWIDGSKTANIWMMLREFRIMRPKGVDDDNAHSG
jgi:anti-anti-sigma regulatory factor